jgi:glyoxylase-like metal-dependent hydrolase (beta-lactamase superfamily II)
MLILEQWLSGRDFAREKFSAAEMLNFVYLIGDTDSGKAWLVDPAWDAAELTGKVEAKGLSLAGALYTHWHPDHAGGDLFGLNVEGAAEFKKNHGVPVHMHEADIPLYLQHSQAMSAGDFTPFQDGTALSLGKVEARCLHTPGHSPGSTCFIVDGEPASLVSGDLLFVGSCGRMDLPGSDPADMYRSLNERLSFLPDDTAVYPGHHYGPAPSSTMGEERKSNMVLQVPSLEAWLASMA